MKILIISFVYFPEPIGLHEHDLAMGLKELGNEVYVITSLPSYPFGKVYDGYQGKKNKWENINGVQVFRVPFVGNRSKSAVRRVLSFLSFTYFTLKALFINKLNPQIIRTYQLGLPGLISSIFLNIPLNHEVADLWPEWANTNNIGINKFFFKLLDWQQVRIYKHAKNITTISESFKTHLSKKGINENKIYVIPSWAPGIQNKEHDKSEPFGIKENLIGKFNILYTGNIGSAQGLDIIIKCAKEMGKNEKIQFIIIGDGIERFKLEKQTKDYGLDQVRFLGWKDPTELNDFFSWADLLFLPLGNELVYQYTIPSKTYTYLAKGKPIIAAVSGETANLINEVGAGIVIKPGDYLGFAEAIKLFLKMDRTKMADYGKNAKKSYEERFEKSLLINQYNQILTDSVHKKI